jgi:hypothetical protein
VRGLSEDCPDAYKNPSCPYITQINLNTAANGETRQVVTRVNDALKALLGEDLTGLNNGVIRTLFDKIGELQKCQQDQKTLNAVERSWVDNVKPVALTVVSVVLTAAFEYWLLKG